MMSNKLFYSSPRARFLDTNGDPLTSGRVTFYEAGTTTEKTIYTDSENSIPTPNPFLLDAEGYVVDGGVWLGAGKYKMKLEKALVPNPNILEDSDFSLLWTINNIQGSTSLNTGELSTIVVATIADMKALTAGEYSLVYVAGYYEANDGGGGWFNYSSGDNQADNGGTVVSPDGAPALGRYLRNLENWEVSVQYFGATSTATSVIDSYVQNCLAWCVVNSRTMVFPKDTYTFGTTQTYQGDITIRVKESALFRSDASITINLEPQNLEVEGVTNHLGDGVVLYFAPITPNSFRPEHWGAVGGTNNNLDWKGFSEADGRYSDSTLILSANYKPFIPAGSQGTAFSIQKCHLLSGGSLDTDATISLGNYTFEEEVNNFWLFDIDKLDGYTMNNLYLDHFDYSQGTTALSDADFVILADAVTNTNTRHGTLQLLTGGLYLVNTISELASYSIDLYIKTGNRIKAVGASNLPRLLNNISDFSILDNSGDTIKLQGNKHSILWWGASSSTNSATTLLGIKKAIDSASLDSNRGYVTGNNESLNLTSESMTITTPFVELVDFKFSNTSGFNITFSGGNLKAYNCAFTGLVVTAGVNYTFESCEISGATDTTIVASIIEISRCNFVMTSSETLTLTSTLELYYEGNRSSSGRFDFTTGSSTNVISNNRFNGLVRVGTGDQSFLIVRGGNFTAINSNVFKGVGTYAGGGIASFVDMIGGGFSVVGFVSKANSFTTDSGLGSDWASYTASGYSTTGHFAVVRGNSFTSGVEEIGTFVEFSDGNVLASSFIKTFKGIFPNATYPAIFWSSSDYIDTPYLDQTVTSTLTAGMMSYDLKLLNLQTGSPRRLTIGLSANCEKVIF